MKFSHFVEGTNNICIYDLRSMLTEQFYCYFSENLRQFSAPLNKQTVKP